jgi:hypothetical protein
MNLIIKLIVFNFITLIALTACTLQTTLPEAVTSTPLQTVPISSPQVTRANPSPSPTVPCVTATPVAARLPSQGSTIATAVPAERTTPGAIQSTPSPQELATLEAAEAKSGKPGPTLPIGSVQSQTIPICPTATPTAKP